MRLSARGLKWVLILRCQDTFWPNVLPAAAVNMHPYRQYDIFYAACVLFLRVTPRTLDPDVDTPRVNVDQQGEKQHKNVSSGRLTHHVVLFYYGSIATASHPPHAKCKIFQTVSVRQHNWFLSFFVFFNPPPHRLPLLLQTHFVQLQPCGLSNWCSSLVG